jgi:hypothetical protein
MSDVMPLSEATEEQIVRLHDDGEREAVRAMLLEFGTQRWHTDTERVRFDILYLSAGDVTRVRKLVDIAMRDHRNVMAREYFHEGGIYRPHEWALVHEVNRRLQARIDAGEVRPRQPIRRCDRGGSPDRS